MTAVCRRGPVAPRRLHLALARRSASRATLAALAVGLLAAVVPPAAGASEIIARNAKHVRLMVDANGRALVSYTSKGRRRHVLASGAVGALPPTSGRPQVEFTLDYSRKGRATRRALRTAFAGGCGTYDGPPLVWLVAACKAPDGSYWALQRWQRLQPMRGVEPWLPRHRAVELHLSHWTGPLPVLDVSPNWTYGGSLEGIFGRFTYRGAPVHRNPEGAKGTSNPYVRYVYIDTFNSRYGRGWRRDTGIATHVPNGAFCYSFVPQRLPAGYPSRRRRGPGNGERHRVTATGPGVTPIVQWQGSGLGRFDPIADRVYNAIFDRLLTGDRVCAPER